MLFRSIALILLAAYAIYWKQVRLTLRDASEFTSLVKEHVIGKNRRALQKAPAKQLKRFVQKDIWPADETLHIQIKSDTSDLVLKEEGKKLILSENLQKLKASFRDDIFLTADSGIYTLPSHQFIAENNCVISREKRKILSDKVSFDLASASVTCEPSLGFFEDELNFTADKLIWNRRDKTFRMEGRGDVHFSFTLEEQNPIDEFLRQFL